jgi:hypothetical protein
MKKIILFILISLVSLAGCSTANDTPKANLTEGQIERAKTQDLFNAEQQVWVPLIIENNAREEIDFAYYKNDQDRASFIVAPGTKVGDEEQLDSTLIIVIGPEEEYAKYFIMDNVSGYEWELSVERTTSAVVINVEDSEDEFEPFNLEFRYL